MARPTEGFKLRPHKITGIQEVRFTHAGVRYELSTGERDIGLASREAARIYAEVVSGRWVPGRKGVRPGTPLALIAADWLTSLEQTLDPKTVKQYGMYVKAHWSPFFVSLDRVTTQSIGDYQRLRLTQVQRSTLKKERAALHGFLAFCELEPVNNERIEFPPLPKKKPGVVASEHSKRNVVELELEQVEAILTALPEWSPRKGFAIRARFVFAYETGLRPATLDELEFPRDYRSGKWLSIRDEIDKVRFGRKVPLTPRARRAIKSVIRGPGLIFGHHDYRDHLKAAGKAAGLKGDDAKHFSPYDLRHARLTHLVESSGGNLNGVAYIAGHLDVTTTNRYVHPGRKAAERVLASAPKTPARRAVS